MDGEKVLDSLMHECFGNIISSLDEINDYEKELSEGSDGLLEGGTSKINTIPYGKPGGCHSLLVVIIDGKKDVDLVLNKTLMHVGVNCKGITKYVLFYVANENVDWESPWLLYKPSFDELRDKYGIQYFIYHKKQFRAELQEVVKELNGFEYIKNPSEEVIEAIVLIEPHYQHKNLICKTIFANKKSHCYFSFKIQANKTMIHAPGQNGGIDANVILEKIKNHISSKHKVDLVIGFSEDFLPELTYSQIITNESDLDNYIKFCKEKFKAKVRKGRM